MSYLDQPIVMHDVDDEVDGLAFSPVSRCPKCGCRVAFDTPTYVEWSDGAPEHLRWPCKRCGYTIETATV